MLDGRPLFGARLRLTTSPSMPTMMVTSGISRPTPGTSARSHHQSPGGLHLSLAPSCRRLVVALVVDGTEIPDPAPPVGPFPIGSGPELVRSKEDDDEVPLVTRATRSLAFPSSHRVRSSNRHPCGPIARCRSGLSPNRYPLRPLPAGGRRWCRHSGCSVLLPS